MSADKLLTDKVDAKTAVERCAAMCREHQHESPFAAKLAVQMERYAASMRHDKIACVFRTGCQSPDDCREHGYCNSVFAQNLRKATATVEEGPLTGDMRSPWALPVRAVDCGLRIVDADGYSVCRLPAGRSDEQTRTLVNIINALVAQSLEQRESSPQAEGSRSSECIPSATARKLEKPAQVGNTIFGVGLDESMVIERAQREHDYHQRPEREAVRIARSNTAFRLINVEAALAELVELKGMKDALESATLRGPEWNAMNDDYLRRKPHAWQRAREILQGFTEESVAPEEERKKP